MGACGDGEALHAGTTAAAGTVGEGDWTLGLSASALSGLSSAYAGVYFEKYVKGRMSSTLWIRNLQLGIYGVPLSIAYMYAKDHANLAHGGVMQVHQPCFTLVKSVNKVCVTCLGYSAWCLAITQHVGHVMQATCQAVSNRQHLGGSSKSCANCAATACWMSLYASTMTLYSLLSAKYSATTTSGIARVM